MSGFWDSCNEADARKRSGRRPKYIREWSPSTVPKGIPHNWESMSLDALWLDLNARREQRRVEHQASNNEDEDEVA